MSTTPKDLYLNNPELERLRAINAEMRECLLEAKHWVSIRDPIFMRIHRVLALGRPELDHDRTPQPAQAVIPLNELVVPIEPGEPG
jgi:hypothetical protein